MDNREEQFQIENVEIPDSAEVTQDIEDKIDDAEKEEYFYTKKAALSHIVINNEIFQIEKKDNGFIATHVNDKMICRLFYDEKFRNIRKEIWNTTATENLQNIIYEYGDEDTKPAGKIIEKFTEKPAEKEIVSYNSEKLAYKSDEYVLISEDDKNTDKTKQKIICHNEWEYDSQNRVIKSIKNEYIYTDKNYDKLSYVFEKKYIYSYHDSVANENGEEIEIPADTEYYEDNVVRMRNIYKTKDEYIKQYIFDDGLSITSYYFDDKLSKEIYRMNNKVTRIKNYD